MYALRKIAIRVFSKSLACFCVGTMMVGGAAASAMAENWSLDTTFSADGIVTTAIGSTSMANAVAIQPDGKIIVTGSSRVGSSWKIAVVRYNGNGSLDKKFGANGRVTTGFANMKETGANAVAIQPDGKIVVVGYTCPCAQMEIFEWAVVRYNGNGSLDKTFGANGKLVTSFRDINALGANAVAIQPDGKIVIAGYAGVMRLNNNGSLDNSFGTNRLGDTSISNADSIVIQSDGKIVVSEGSRLARINSNGTIDATFGSDGILDLEEIDLFFLNSSLALQSDGKLVIVSACEPDWRSNRRVGCAVRINSDGSLDSSFGSGGIVTKSIGPSLNLFDDAVIQKDGKIIVGGDSYDEFLNSSKFTVLRFNQDGSLDSGFGNNGIVSASPGRSFNGVNALAIQNDGKVVVAGQSRFGEVFRFAVVRLQARRLKG